ncbi:hypothetical protein MUBE_09955 [Mycobacterium uberis]|uniref:Uncharacterized protein n=1 Tax=Mycobacterium uberis TaxID=2162698 RepID=A0A3E1HGG2_9MYCO|nr:hypothetical protein MUBE_09955 [Mycobacterium uberis]
MWTALNERVREGAKQLVAILNHRSTPMLRPLPVDIEQLPLPIEVDLVWGQGRINLKTGDCWPYSSDCQDVIVLTMMRERCFPSVYKVVFSRRPDELYHFVTRQDGQVLQQFGLR